MTLAGRGVPTLVGAAFKNHGIHNLLDAVIDYLPSPADVGESTADRRRDDLQTRKVGDDEPLAALAFKVQSDDAGGQLTFVRVYTGMPARRRRGAQRDEGHNEQIGRLVRMFANHREDIRQIEAGMIGAVLTSARQARHRRHAVRSPLADPARSRSRCRAPVMGVVVEPETEEDHAKLDRRARAPRDRGPVVPRQDRSPTPARS